MYPPTKISLQGLEIRKNGKCIHSIMSSEGEKRGFI